MEKTIEKERPASHHSKRVEDHVDITTPSIPPTNRLVKGDYRKTTSDIGVGLEGGKSQMSTLKIPPGIGSLPWLFVASLPRMKGIARSVATFAIRPDEEIFIDPSILSPRAAMSALVDEVVLGLEDGPMLVPLSWAKANYPKHAEGLEVKIRESLCGADRNQDLRNEVNKSAHEWRSKDKCVPMAGPGDEEEFVVGCLPRIRPIGRFLPRFAVRRRGAIFIDSRISHCLERSSTWKSSAEAWVFLKPGWLMLEPLSNVRVNYTDDDGILDVFEEKIRELVSGFVFPGGKEGGVAL
jgi:hypothetical protein